MLVTEGTAVARTATLTVMVLVPLVASGPGLVQVTTWLVMPQLQPLPLAPVGVRPAGTESIAVIVPKLAAVPALEIVIVYAAATPAVKFPVWLLAIARSGAVTVTWVGWTPAVPGSSLTPVSELPRLWPT